MVENMTKSGQPLTVRTRIREIEELKPFSKYLLYNPGNPKDFLEGESFASLEKTIPPWNAESMLNGVKRLLEAAVKGQVLYPVYEEKRDESTECVMEKPDGAEWADDPQKRDVFIWNFPAMEKNTCMCEAGEALSEDTARKKPLPFIIVAAGGGYESVCSIVEGFSTIAHFNQLGYHVFALNYRVSGDGVMPKPLEDLAAAYHCICRHADEFGIESPEYVVCGFSAGGNLTGLWGTESRGYAHYDMKKPKMLITVYPVVNLYQISEKLEDDFLNTMLGKGYTQEKLASYNIPDIFTAEYPPCYIVHCKDDSTVPVENSMCLKKLLDDAGIPARLELGRKGEHGFGDGCGSDVQGWPKRAIEFLESLL